MTVDIVAYSDRPDLEDEMWALTDLWPTYMGHDPIADLFFNRIDEYPGWALLVLDGDQVVGRAYAVPFAMGDERRPRLPDDGWDGVIRWAWLDSLSGRPPTHASMLEITLQPEYRGRGLPALILERVKDHARRAGLASLVAPVRPTGKAAEPRTPMAEYATRTAPDGLPADRWLRTHVRVGARIVGVCPTSMTFSGTLSKWRAWTGLPLDRSGSHDVPGALAPLHVDVDQDHAVYVEPNVWVEHPL